jgi:hypothetical protein
VEVALDPLVKLTLVGLTLDVRPVPVGEILVVNETVPVNPTLAIVIVLAVELPAKIVTLGGEADIVKSELVTVKVTLVLWDRLPLVPVIVIV